MSWPLQYFLRKYHRTSASSQAPCLKCLAQTALNWALPTSPYWLPQQSLTHSHTQRKIIPPDQVSPQFTALNLCSKQEIRLCLLLPGLNFQHSPCFLTKQMWQMHNFTHLEVIHLLSSSGVRDSDPFNCPVRIICSFLFT